MSPRLYVDNAATSFPKPPGVIEAMRAYAADLGASAGRGAYREAVETGRIVAECRRRLARLIGAAAPEQVIFTANCTTALNLAMKGVLREGDHVVITSMEHNSVVRPLQAMSRAELIDLTIVQAEQSSGLVAVEDLFDAVRTSTRLIVVTHASNVTGTLQPVEAIAREARTRGILTLVDAAQTAGHLPIGVEQMGIDLLALPGHKGLMGPHGTGALYIRPGLEDEVRPLIEGGTGSVSERTVQPDFMPDRFESGTHNAIGLAGLDAALQWIEAETVEGLHEHQRDLSRRFLEGIGGVRGLTVCGPRDAEKQVAVFSVCPAGGEHRRDAGATSMEPVELSAVLEAEFGILTRAGMHCAPLAHQTIGTHGGGGTTRLSFGAFNTPADVDRCVEALAQLAGTAAPA